MSTYASGNLERWGFSISTYLPQAWTLLTQTIDPLVTATLIELLGSNTQFMKKDGSLTPMVDADKNIIGFAVKLVFSVPEFIGYSGEPEAIKQDQAYIYNKIQLIPGVKWSPNCIKISTQTGTIELTFTINVGYA